MGKQGASRGGAQEIRAPAFEPLEPRILLDADLIGTRPLSCPEAAWGDEAIVVDLSREEAGSREDDSCVIVTLPGSSGWARLTGQPDTSARPPVSDPRRAAALRGLGAVGQEEATDSEAESAADPTRSGAAGLNLQTPGGSVVVLDGTAGQVLSGTLEGCPERRNCAVASVAVQAPADAAPRGPPAASETTVSQIVFVDPAVNQSFQIENAEIPGVAVVVLAAGQDGIRQIFDILSGYHNLSAIHILSHGAPGQVNLGTAKLNLSCLDDYARDLGAWGESLTPDGDILLYGCSIAQGQAGTVLTEGIAELTRADVAASTDATGEAGLGGDWVLEETTGPVEAPALAMSIDDGFHGLLAAGDLDPTFGTAGKVVTPIGPSIDYGLSVALQSDGKIVVAGYSSNGSNDDFALVRYNLDGSLDTSFGSDGKVTTPIGASADYGYGVAIQSDGGIVVAGASYNGRDSDFALVRYHTDGVLDASFGMGGKVTTAIGPADDWGYSVVLQSDGRIVVAGYSSNGSNDDFALVRYNTNGSLDTSFGAGGKVTTPVGASWDCGYSVALQSDGKMVVAGGSVIGSNSDFAVVRYHTDGSLDTSFGTGGKVATPLGPSTDYGYSVALQSDGRIVVGGYSENAGNDDFAVVRYHTNGSLDASFSGDGKVTTSFGSWDERGHSVALQSDGKMVVAGYGENRSNDDFAVVRYRPDGSLDASFSGDGKVITSFGSSDERGQSVVIQSDGRIVVAGCRYNGSDYDFALARYEGDAVIIPPEITVEGKGVSIGDEDTTPSTADDTDFGSVPVGDSPVSHTFTVRNDGGSALTLGAVTVPAGFTLTEGLSASLAPGATDTFTVGLDAAVAATREGEIAFTNNDEDENPFNFWITGTVEGPVVFADANLKATVESALGVTDPAPGEMLALTSLWAGEAGITDLTGLAYATNLTSLGLWSNQISDLSALSGMTNLAELYAGSNQIRDLAALSGLAHLSRLYLESNPLNQQAYATYLPLIGTNNPGIDLQYDSPGRIEGWNCDDQDSDGEWDAGEPGLSGWTIYLDQDQDGVPDTGEPSAVTAADGSYALEYLSAQTYYVTNVEESGWVHTYPALWQTVVLGVSQVVSNVRLGNVIEANARPMVTLIDATTTLAENTDTGSRMKVADIAVVNDDIGSYLVIDDIESYTDESGQYIFDTWMDGGANGTGSAVGYMSPPFAEQTIVHGGGQSMPLSYDNGVGPFYSEAYRTFDTPQDWTADGATELSLWFMGRSTNAIDDLYVVVEDDAGRWAAAVHPDPNALIAARWIGWLVPLSTFSAGGIDLASVRRIYIGVGDRSDPQAGGSGLIYVDDLGLRCPHSSTPATLGLSGEDQALFEIDGGALYLRAAVLLDYETDPQLDVTVELDDPTVGSTPDDTANLSIAIADVNEAPTDIIFSVETIAENTDARNGYIVGPIGGIDPDTSVPFNTLTFSVVGGADAAKFRVDGLERLVLVDGFLDYESPRDANADGVYEVVLRVRDGGGLSYEEAFTIRVTDVEPEPTWVVMFSDGFEGTFPDGWVLSGTPTWGATSYYAHTGSQSAYCVGSAIAAPGPYPNDVDARMVWGPFSLADAMDAKVDFWSWNRSESSNDRFGWYASVDGVSWYGVYASGNANYWWARTFDLKNVPTLGNLCGRSQVWIAFRFASNSSVTDTGAFVDDVVLSKVLREDAYEENDMQAAAWDLSPGADRWLSNYGGARGVQGDDDWYRIEAALDNQPLFVQCTFVQDEGNVDIELYDAAGELMARSAGAGNAERIDAAAPAAGAYYVRVCGQDARNYYDLLWGRWDAPPVLTVSGVTTYVEEAAPGVLAPDLALTDSDPGATLDQAVVLIGGATRRPAEDRLGILGQAGTKGIVNGIDWSYDVATGVLTLRGVRPISDYEAALRQVTYSNLSQAPDTTTRSIEFHAGGSLYYPGTGHFYEYIAASPCSWPMARDAAALCQRFGLQGYLTTVTSAGEQDFIESRLWGDAWMGATDAENEGMWQWVTGPEAGTHFFTQTPGGSGGTAVGDSYVNWYPGEPNNNMGQENWAHFYGMPQAPWNDKGSTDIAEGYVVEYGGMPGDPVLQVRGVVTVNVLSAVDLPTVSLTDTTVTLPEDTDTRRRIRVADIVVSDDDRSFLTVDDMESYRDEEGRRLYETWVDGRTNGTGSRVGHLTAPFAEGTIVHGDGQSMPVTYDNRAGPFYSETYRAFEVPQDWTTGGATDLSLWLRGRPALATDPTRSGAAGPTRSGAAGTSPGTVLVSGAGTDIWGTADEFVFVYKSLAGDGSIVARVDSPAAPLRVGVGYTDWRAKAGVMIRETLDAGSTFAAVYATPRNGVRFQARTSTGGSATSDTSAALLEQMTLQAPMWIRIERSGDTFRGFYSSDGVTWTLMSWAPQTISMASEVYVGLAVTSHNANEACVAEFSGVAISGDISGSGQVAEIGVDHPDNTPDDFYVAIEDAAGRVAVVTHPDPNVLTATDWTQWCIPLSAFSAAGVDLTAVAKLYVGVGDRDTPDPGGTGLVYVDDIALYYCPQATVSLSGADRMLFEIVGPTLYLKAGAPLDYETNPQLDVTVTVDDAAVGATPDDAVPLSIVVVDVNETPTVTLARTTTRLAVDADTTIRIKVADIVVADDALGTHVLSLSGPDAASFEMEGTELYLKAGTVLDCEAKPQFEVEVAVDDATVGGTPDDAAALVIAVGDQDLVIRVAAAPATAIGGASIPVSWTVLNQGNDSAGADWYDSIYLSADTVPSGDDVSVGSDWIVLQTPLAAGADYTINRTVLLPLVAPGDWYLLFVVDAQNHQLELEEGNNVYAAPISLGKTIVLGEVARGAIETPGVVDRWHCNLAAGQTVFLDVQQIGGTEQILNWRFQAPDGSTVFSAGASSGTPNLADHGPTLLTEGGIYTLIVSGQGDDTAGYQYVLYNVPGPDLQAVGLGEVARGAIETPGVADRWVIDMAAGQTIYLDMQEIGGTDQILNWQFQAPDGRTVFSQPGYSGAPGWADCGPILLTEGGIYTLTVTGVGDDTASYQFQPFHVPETDVRTLGATGIATAAIEAPTAVDKWQFTVTANRTISLDVQEITGTGQYLVFILNAPDETRVFTTIGSSASPDSGDQGPVILTQAGTYTLTVSGHGSDMMAGYRFEIVGVGPPRIVSYSLHGTSPAAVDAFWIGFNQGMDETSFLEADDLLSLTGPEGSLRGVDHHWANPQTLVLTFDPQPADGVYQVTLGPQILSLAGEALDQDRDTVPGESPEDQSTGVSSPRQTALGQTVTGRVLPGGIDRWVFSGLAGQQIRFDLRNCSGQNVVFDLAGPHGWTGLEGLTADSELVVLPSSGRYILCVRNGSGSAAGTYTFQVQETAQTDLALGLPYEGELLADGQAQLFRVNVPGAVSMRIDLDGLSANSHNELYVKFGSPPTRADYEYRSSGTAAADQNVLVPLAKAGTYYILMYGAYVPSPGNYTLLATTAEMVFLDLTPDRQIAGVDAVLTISGAGFDRTTTVELVAQTGAIYPAGRVEIDSFRQITATFAAGTVPVDLYTVRVRRADGASAEKANAFSMLGAGTSALKTNLVLPRAFGYHVRATLYVEYANTGEAPMPAPLLVLTATQNGRQAAIMTLDESRLPTGFWTSGLPEGFSNTIQFLAYGEAPGVLQPGESQRVPVYWAGWQQPWDFSYAPIYFNLGVVTADNLVPVAWDALKDSTRPESISVEAWEPLWANLVAQTGRTWGDYVRMLGENAAYLARLGQAVFDPDAQPGRTAARRAWGGVGRLFNFEVQQADGLRPLSCLWAAVDHSATAPGLSVSFARTFAGVSVSSRYELGVLGRGWSHNWEWSLERRADGVVVIHGPGGARRVFEPDIRGGSYFSQPGEYGKLTALAGDNFTLREPDGLLYVFGVDGKLDHLQDTNGNRIQAGYTEDRLTSLRHSSGPSLTITYNAAGCIESITDSLGRQTLYAYDASSEHLTSVQCYDGRTIGYSYVTGAGIVTEHALAEIAYPGSLHEYFVYDARGHLAGTHRDGGAEAVAFFYDTTGRVTLTDALGNSSRLFYDDRGLLARTEDPVGNYVNQYYDDNFHLARVTDSAGRSYNYSYDGRGNLTQIVDPLGHVTHFTYASAFNRLASVVDPNGNAMGYAYDTHGNLLAITYADGASETWQYGAFGNASAWTNRRGQTIGYTYDSAGRITSKLYADGSRVEYAYDARGNLITTVDAHGTATFTYDANDYLIRIEYPEGPRLEFTYDAAGRRASSTDQLGDLTNYHYGAVGRLERLTDGAENLIVQYTYDAAGRLIREDKGNGTYTTYEYDAAGQILHLVNYAPDGTVNSHFDYTYDAFGRRTSMDTIYGLWTYEYDAVGQLIHATLVSTDAGIPSQDIVYEYDAAGNRISVTENGATTCYTTNNMNQYTAVGTATYEYDADGNMISRTEGGMTTTYTFDVENRLIGVTTPSDTRTYQYDALGQRVASVENGMITRYIVDPIGFGNVVAEYAGDGSLLTRYEHGYGLVARTDPTVGTAYYSFDALGSTDTLTDSAGTVVNAYAYGPFGTSLSRSEGLANPFEYVGRHGVMGDTDGWDFVRARFYQAELGRFTSEDPIGLLGRDSNLYCYAWNAPINYMDVTGTDPAPSTLPGPIAIPGGMDPDPRGGLLKKLAGESLKRVLEYQKEISKTPPRHPLDGADWIPDGEPPRDEPTPPRGVKNEQGIWVPVIPVPLPQDDPDGGDPVPSRGPVDPNEKTGTGGFGDAAYVRSDSLLSYRIDFENDATATAPAQRVDIVDQLSSNLDWATFALTEIGFGDRLLTVPAGLQHFATTVTTAASNGRLIEVQIEVGIHAGTGQVYATFQTLEPGTELPPDITTGFLAPEDGTGHGMGHVSYVIYPRSGLVTGTEIRNIALITFDFGETIATNQVAPHDPSQGTDPTKECLNTIDAGAPSSQVSPLPAETPEYFVVSWWGQDDVGGSGIASCDVYVREDSGSWQLWLNDTTETHAEFAGVVGHAYAFRSVATDNVGYVEDDAGVAEAQTTVTTTLLRLDQWQVQPWGFVASFNRAIDISVLNVYDAATAGYGPADVTVVGQTVGAVSGSLVVSPDSKTVTFIKTGGALEPDTYTITIRSTATGLRDTEGSLLDGDRDYVAGGDYVTTMVVAAGAARLVSVPDFTCGPGQVVDVPATGFGIPVLLSDGQDVQAVDFVLRYDPQLLSVTNLMPGLDVPADWSLVFNDSVPGQIPVTLHGLTPLPAGEITLVTIAASVPNETPYTLAGIVGIEDLQINEGKVKACADGGVQVVAYLGDPTGNHGYSGLDASYIARVSAGLDRGFAKYRLKDPVLIGDVTGNGWLSDLDSSYVARKAVGLSQPQIPDLPSGLPPIVSGGRDPQLDIPDDLTAHRGQTLTIPVMILDDAAGLLAADLYLKYDTAVFDVADSDVHVGDLTAGWGLMPNVVDAAGTITVAVYGIIPLSGGAGSVVEIDFHVRADGPYGQTALDLTDDTALNEDELVATLYGGLVTILAENLPPIAVDDVLTVSEDERRIITVAELLGNDNDPDLTDTLSVMSIQTTETRGTLTDNGDGTFTFDPRAGFDDLSAGQSATYVFTYTVGDGRGGEDSAQVTITVTGVNDAPTVTTLTVTPDPVDENATVTLQGTFTDPDSSGAFVVTVIDWGDGTPVEEFAGPVGTFSRSHQYLDDSPGGTAFDEYSIAVMVTDDDLGSDSETIGVTVANIAPTLDGVSATGANEGSASTLSGTITDPGTLDTFTVSVDWGDGTPAEEFSASAGMFGRTHIYANDGVYSISVEVQDDDLGADTAGTTATILNVAPAADAGGPYTIDQGDDLALSGSAADPGIADLLEYAWDLNGDGEFGDADGAAPIVPWSTLAALDLGKGGTYPIVLRVSDGVTFAVASATLTINSINVPPELAAIGNQVIAEEVLLTFITTATDADIPAQPLTFSLAEAPAGASIDPASGVFTWTPIEAQGPAEYTFTIVVRDGSLMDAETITVTVSEVNVAPVLDAIGPQKVTEERLLTFTASATDNDIPANALTFSLVDAPAGASIDAATGVFTWTPTEAQGPADYVFTVVVSDGLLTDSEMVTITVEAANEAPTVTLQNTITTLAENLDTTMRRKVADIVVVDDGLGTNVLSLGGTEAALFETMDSVLYLRAGVALDYETNPQLEVIVAVDDATVGATPDDTASLLIAVTGTVDVTTENLALNKMAVASTSYQGYPPANATDGKTSSRWSSQFSDNQWIYVDLGSVYTIDRVLLRWETAYGRGYKIQVSNPAAPLRVGDASRWLDLYSTTTGDGSVDDITLRAPGSGRYVRMLGTQRATMYGYSLWELEVYGSGAVNHPPVVSSFSRTLAQDTPLPLATLDFAAVFTDPDAGDSLQKIQITSLPGHGVLTLNGPAVSVNQEIAAAQIGTLRYTPDSGYTGADSFHWNGSDGNLYAATEAAVNLSVTPAVANLALHKPTAASTSYGGYPPENATDGNPSSRWSSRFSNNEWLSVDLGSIYTINRVVLRWETAYGRGYQLQVSSDAAYWSEVYGTILGDGGVDDLVLTAPASGRYVRMLGTRRGTVYGYSLYEIEVYGSAVPNHAPSVSNLGRTLAQDTPLLFAAADFAGAFADPDAGDRLQAIKIVSLPSHGLLTLDGVGVSLDQEIVAGQLGTLIYTPDGGYSGADSFRWNGSDGGLYAVSDATVNLSIAAAAENLALNKVAVASTSYGGYPASSATDGRMSSRWSSRFSNSEWIYVDLGSVSTVHQIVLRWETAYARGYKLQVSNPAAPLRVGDAATWSDVYSTTTGDGGVDDVTLSTPAAGRYVRMLGTQRATGYGYSLWEFEVYGEAGAPTVTVTIAPSVVTEDGSTNLVYTFARSVASGSPLRVNFSVGGTATYATDYTPTGADGFTATAGTVTIGASRATATVTVDPTADAMVEPDETVVLTVMAGAGYTVGAPSTATGTIRNDDRPKNLAGNKVAVASTSYSGYPPLNVTDGLRSSRWSSKFSDSEWIYVDLGSVCTIRRMVLWWEVAYARGYRLQVSSDASGWSDLYGTTAGDGGVDDVTLSAPAAGRYVRMLGSRRGTAYGYSLWEFEVYG